MEKASDIGIRRGQKEYPLASVRGYILSNESKECLLLLLSYFSRV